MPEEHPKKHVIILGAGASVSSGYPVADQLRLLMSSEKRLRERLGELAPFKTEYVDRIIERMMGEPASRAIELFRHGGFATVDEFSNLAGFQMPKETQELKKLMRFCLALHNPEDDFEKADYYYFI